MTSAGKKFREALAQEKPLQIVGVINAYVAIMAQEVGFRVLYLSGAGIANSAYGVPDTGITTLENVVEETQRITHAIDLPLLVDIDTGWGNIQKSVKSIANAGAAAVHIEDQIASKRCGHLSGKTIVSIEEMVDRICAAVEAKPNPDFVIIARSDAFANEGLEETVKRAQAYEKAGADLFFPEALTDLKQYQAIKENISIPILANVTEFGKTPLFSTEELASAGVDIALFPLSANRAMNQAALNVLQEIKKKMAHKGIA